MNEYIERQAALDALGERPLAWTEDDYYSLGARNQYDGDRLAIETIPSADVEPVRHGRWEVFYAEELCGYRHAYYVCSSCFGSSDDEFDYCPNCGAMMDEAGE